MGLFSGIPIVGGILDSVTGGGAVDAANRVAGRTNDLNAQYLEMARQIFGEQISAVARARESGAFNPELIKKDVMRNVTTSLSNLSALGKESGFKSGDTAQSERIAQGAIRGGRALNDVPLLAAQREIGLLGQVNLGGVGAATGQAVQGNIAGGQLVANAQQAQANTIGSIASLGFGLAQGGGASPQFGMDFTGANKFGQGYTSVNSQNMFQQPAPAFRF